MNGSLRTKEFIIEVPTIIQKFNSENGVVGKN